MSTKFKNLNIETLHNFLLEKANRGCWIEDEDFNPYEFSGGNYDDAYFGGSADGEALLAKQLLKEFFNA